MDPYASASVGNNYHTVYSAAGQGTFAPNGKETSPCGEDFRYENQHMGLSSFHGIEHGQTTLMQQSQYANPQSFLATNTTIGASHTPMHQPLLPNTRGIPTEKRLHPPCENFLMDGYLASNGFCEGRISEENPLQAVVMRRSVFHDSPWEADTVQSEGPIIQEVEHQSPTPPNSTLVNSGLDISNECKLISTRPKLLSELKYCLDVGRTKLAGIRAAKQKLKARKINQVLDVMVRDIYGVLRNTRPDILSPCFTDSNRIVSEAEEETFMGDFILKLIGWTLQLPKRFTMKAMDRKIESQRNKFNPEMTTAHIRHVRDLFKNLYKNSRSQTQDMSLMQYSYRHQATEIDQHGNCS